MLVEVGDQTAWEVHDALLLCTESDFEGTTRLKAFNKDPPAFLSLFHDGHRNLHKKHVPAEWTLGMEHWFAILAIKSTLEVELD